MTEGSDEDLLAAIGADPDAKGTRIASGVPVTVPEAEPEPGQEPAPPRGDLNVSSHQPGWPSFCGLM